MFANTCTCSTGTMNLLSSVFIAINKLLPAYNVNVHVSSVSALIKTVLDQLDVNTKDSKDQ